MSLFRKEKERWNKDIPEWSLSVPVSVPVQVPASASVWASQGRGAECQDRPHITGSQAGKSLSYCDVDKSNWLRQRHYDYG